MNRRLISLALASTLAITAVAAFATTASASFHLNLIREVHEGNGTTGDYVELQATAAGQNLVAGQHIVSYDGGGGVLTDFTIPSNVSNGANQATILIAHDASTPGADFIAGANLNVDNTGGTVCYGSSPTSAVDCVAFKGNGISPTMFPTPPPSPYGNAFALPGAAPNAQLGPNASLIRTEARGCATQLDAADDTNNSAADFSIGAGSPRGNSATPTEKPCAAAPTCAGKTATITGTNGNDRLKGTSGADVIAGLGGNDVIKGLAGNDVICGGPGKDKLLGGAGNDKLLGQGGKDTLIGGPGKDKLKGGPGKDVQIQ